MTVQLRIHRGRRLKLKLIPVHTVITHRRNIARKLQIHSPAGLTIYAIVNKLVELGKVGALIRRIIMDEEMHLAALKEYYAKMCNV